jgi:hypothetical protein
METMKPEQALQSLYAASRTAPLSAEQHEVCKQAAIVLQGVISPSPKKDKPKKK